MDEVFAELESRRKSGNERSPIGRHSPRRSNRVHHDATGSRLVASLLVAVALVGAYFTIDGAQPYAVALLVALVPRRRLSLLAVQHELLYSAS
jgi:hypothetical protein